MEWYAKYKVMYNKYEGKLWNINRDVDSPL